MSSGYQELKAWVKSMDLVEIVYRETIRMPAEERFGLTAQMRRAAVSVPSNIAEGHSRQNPGHYRHHLQMARGSVAELETQLTLSVRLGFLEQTQAQPSLNLCNEVSRMLNALIKTLPHS